MNRLPFKKRILHVHLRFKTRTLLTMAWIISAPAYGAEQAPFLDVIKAQETITPKLNAALIPEGQNALYSPFCAAQFFDAFQTITDPDDFPQAEIKALLETEISNEARQHFNQILQDRIKGKERIQGLTFNHGSYVLHNDEYSVDGMKKETVNQLGLYPLSVNYSNPAESAKTINDFAAKQTHGMISEIVKADELNNPVGYMLLSTLYFSTRWPENRFSTKSVLFKTPTMTKEVKGFGFKDMQLSHWLTSEFKSVWLYSQGSINLYVRQNHDASLTPIDMNFVNAFNTNCTDGGGTFKMPEFEIATDLNLREKLHGLLPQFMGGIPFKTTLFNSNMTLPLVSSKQVNRLYVTKEGMKGASVTSGLVARCLPNSEKALLDVVIDGPFSFAVVMVLTKDFTQGASQRLILFSGQVVDPVTPKMVTID